MFFTRLPELSGHIWFQHLKGYLYALLVMAVFVAVPFMVQGIESLIYGGSEHTMIQTVLGWWVYLFVASPFLVLLRNELGARFLMKHEGSGPSFSGFFHVVGKFGMRFGMRNMLGSGGGLEENREPKIRAWLEELSAKAGLSKVPTLIFLPHKMMNAAATRSLTYGRKVLLVGKAHELPDAELRAVIAHELGHLSNWDILPRLLLTILVQAISLQLMLVLSVAFLPAIVLGFIVARVLGRAASGLVKLAVFGGVLYLFYDWVDPSWLDVVYIVLSLALLFTVQVVMTLLMAGLSRCREYLADAAAVKYIGWENRADLIKALHHLNNHMREIDADMVRKMKKVPRVLLSHPKLEQRTKALKLDPQDFAPGGVHHVSPFNFD